MAISEQDIKFAGFILGKSDKQHMLQPILDRCERDNITVWMHFEEGLKMRYGYSDSEAQETMKKWHIEFLHHDAFPAAEDKKGNSLRKVLTIAVIIAALLFLGIMFAL